MIRRIIRRLRGISEQRYFGFMALVLCVVWTVMEFHNPYESTVDITVSVVLFVIGVICLFCKGVFYDEI